MSTPDPFTPASLPPEALDQLFREARTANTFAETDVSDEQLEAIYDLTRMGPTAMNAQPLRVVFVRPGEGRDRLLKHVSDGNRDKTASAPVVAILAYDADFHEHLPEVFPHRPDLKDSFTDAARRARMAEFNAGIQIGYFILAVRAAGLAAGPMGGFDRAAVDEEFFEGSPLRSMLLVNIGHPGEDPWFDRLPRLPYDAAVSHA